MRLPSNANFGVGNLLGVAHSKMKLFTADFGVANADVLTSTLGVITVLYPQDRLGIQN